MKIVIVGLGVIGGSYAMALKNAGYEDVYGIDTNTETLRKAKEMGIIKEGYVEGKEVINEANLKQAKLAILTAPKLETTIRFLKTAKTINPELPIYVRAHTKKEAVKLYELGADLVILPHVLESNYLLEMACDFIREGPKHNKALRSEYLSYLKKE